MSETTIQAWVDLVSPAHPFFFRSLLEGMPNIDAETTVREKTETVDLAASEGFQFDVVGRDFDNPWLRKAGIPLRTGQLVRQAPDVDVSLSSRNAMCVLASKANGVPSIHFTDNDVTAHADGLWAEELYNRLEAQATHNVVPAAFETTELTKRGASIDRVHTYDGYKEDIYIASFTADESFTQSLPFEEYIVLRPEALDAAYVSAEQSLVPSLLDRAVDANLNVVYLPRGRGDAEYADPYPTDRVHTPRTAVDGLQLAWHSSGVLTGSGTMAREAACMGKTAVSFFPNQLLSVDSELQRDGRLFHSRYPDAIIEHVQANSGVAPTGDLSRSREVRTEVVDIVTDICRSYSN